MHAIQIHFHDVLDNRRRDQLCHDLMAMPHVAFVGFDAGKAHDLVVEFEEYHNIPMHVIDRLHHQGLHPDITSC